MAEGPNLISNPGFDTDVGFWTDNSTGSAIFFWSATAGGRAEINANPSTSGRAYQAVTVLASTDYKMTYQPAAANANAAGRVGTTSAGAERGSAPFTSGLNSISFTTVGETTVYPNFLLTGWVVPQAVAFDDVTLREQNFTQNSGITIWFFQLLLGLQSVLGGSLIQVKRSLEYKQLVKKIFNYSDDHLFDHPLIELRNFYAVR